MNYNIMDHNITNIINETIADIITTIEYDVICEIYTNNKKNVSFQDFRDVIIIQSIDDLEYYSNKRDLWWSNLDYYHFKLFFKNEVLYFIEYYKNNSNINLSIKEAITMLCKP